MIPVWHVPTGKGLNCTTVWDATNTTLIADCGSKSIALLQQRRNAILCASAPELLELVIALSDCLKNLAPPHDVGAVDLLQDVESLFKRLNDKGVI